MSFFLETDQITAMLIQILHESIAENKIFILLSDKSDKFFHSD